MIRASLFGTRTGYAAAVAFRAMLSVSSKKHKKPAL
jgi:hypothetical protein